MKPQALLLVTILLVATGGRAFAQKPFTVQKPAPATLHTLRAKEVGLCEEIKVSVGDRVLAGQLLVSLDNYKQVYTYETTKRRMNSRSNLKIAEADLNEKQVAHDDAEVQFRRKRISESDYQRAVTALKASEARLELAKDAVEQARLDFELASRALEDRFIRSPVTGVVLTVHRSLGEKVTGGDTVVTVGDLSKLAAEVTVPKDAVAKLAAGALVPIVTTAKGPVLQGIVDSIANGKSPGEKIIRVIFNNPDEPAEPSPLDAVAKNTPAPEAPPAPAKAPEAPRGGS